MRAKIDIKHKVFSQRVPAKWNKIPVETKMKKLASFKKDIKTKMNTWTGGKP